MDQSILQLPSFVRDYIHPLQIFTPFAVGTVFSYLLVDEKIVLIDCGHYAGESCEQVRYQHLFADAIKQGAIFLVLSEVRGYLDWGEREGSIQKIRKSGGIVYKKYNIL